MTLVLVGAVTLVIGFFNTARTGFIYVTIVTSLLAGVCLVFELLRQRPSQKSVLAMSSEGQGANTWGGSSWGAGLSGTATLERDDAEFGGLESSYDDEPIVVEHPSLYDSSKEVDLVEEEPQGEGAAWWAPEATDTNEDALFQTTRLADLGTEWDSDRASWQEFEPEAAPQTLPQPVSQRTNATTDDRESERFLAAIGSVRGVGPSKQAELLAHFRTLRRLRNASVDRLVEVPGISTTLAQRIYKELHN